MTAHTFNTTMVVLCSAGLVTVAALIYVAIVRGHVMEFLYRVGLLIGAIAGAMFDILHHMCMDVRGLFKKKKPIKLDEYEKRIS